VRRLDVQSTLRSEEGRAASAGRQRGLVRSALVVAEVALAVVLMVGAGLLVRSFRHVQGIDAGFDAQGVLKAEFQLPPSRYPVDFRKWPDFVEMHRFNDGLLRRVAALPGVQAASVVGNQPLDAGFTNSFTVVGREDEARSWPEISIRRVSPGYFDTVRLPLRSGRRFLDTDGTRDPAVGLINEAAARRFFAGRDPLGAQVRFWGSNHTVVGVVADEKFHGLTAETPPAIYTPLAQTPSAGGSEALLVRVAGPPGAMMAVVSAAIRAEDHALAVFGVQPLEETVQQSIGQRRFVMLLLSLFAALAVALAAIGIHGVLSYTVAQRRHDIGIRMALGAAPAQVTRQVVGYGARLTLLGLGLGLVGALAVTRLLASLLFGVSTTDATTFVSAIPLLAAVALVATWLPARRAVRIDPLEALREE
jgi:putative ABC transport system permease protein